MNLGNNLWLFYVALNVFFSVLTSLLFRVLAIKSENPRVFSVLFNSFAALFALLLTLLMGSLKQFSIPSIPALSLTFLVIIMWGLYERSHFYIRKQIEASVITLISRIAPVITFFTTVILLKESVTLQKLIGAALIFIGNTLVVFNNKILLGKIKYVFFAIVIYILLGLNWTLDKIVSPFYPSSIYTLIIWSLPVFIIAFPKVSIKEIRNEWNIATWKVILAAISNVLAYFFLIKAFSLTEGSKVIMLYSTESIFVVIAAMVFLKETNNLPRKILATIIVFAGILLIK